MPTKPEKVELSLMELRAIAGYAAACARRVLPIYECYVPDDPRPKNAVEAALDFSNGGARTKVLRTCAWAALRAAQEASAPAAAEAARAAMAAAGAAYLHPLASAAQVKHILGSAAYAARAAELDAGDDRSVGAASCQWALQHAPPSIATVLARYPAAPSGGGRVGELIREFDSALRK